MPLTEEQEKELEPIVSGITGALRELNAQIGKGAAEIKSLTAAISPQAAEQALQAASDETNRYIEFRRQLSQNLVSVHERWQGLVKTRHPEIAAALDGGTELLGRAGELLDNLEQGVADASDYLEEIGEAREALRETIRSSVEDAFDSAGAAAEALGEGLRERLDTLTEHVEELEEKISAALEEAAEEVGEALLVPVKELSEAIKDALKDLSDFVTAKVRDAVLELSGRGFCHAGQGEDRRTGGPAGSRACRARRETGWRKRQDQQQARGPEDGARHPQTRRRSGAACA